MKVFAVVAVLLVAYARGDVTELTQAQVDALSAEQTKSITDEQWGILYSRWCNPAFQSYAKSQYLPDRRNCHYFYECVGFKPVRMECAANLYWNAKVETCDYPYHAGCYYGSGSSSNSLPAHHPSQGVPVPPSNSQPAHHPSQGVPVPPSNSGSNSGSNSNSASSGHDSIEIPINNNPLVVDPYKQ